MSDAAPPAAVPPAATGPVVPAGRSRRAIALFLLLASSVLAVDLGSKYWSFCTVAGTPVVLTPELVADPAGVQRAYPHLPTVVIPKVLNFQLTLNTGAVFGLGKGQRWVFIAVSAFATVVIGLLFWKSPAGAGVLHAALALILAGALGNLYDRWHYAAVRDMLHMLPGVSLPFGLSWPGGSGPQQREVWPWIFNVADVALMVGVGGVLVTSFFAPEPTKNEERRAQGARSKVKI